MNYLKKNFAIILAFALPIGLVVALGLSVYLPSLFLTTNYNFVYTACSDGVYRYQYNCNEYLGKRYSVKDTKLVMNPFDFGQDFDKDGVPDFQGNYTDRIFFHDTLKNESREISLAEAEALSLDGLLTSPDGVTISSPYSRSGGGFFIFDNGYSSYGQYLIKGKGKTKLNLINTTDQYYYRDNFQFIGWVLPGRN